MDGEEIALVLGGGEREEGEGEEGEGEGEGLERHVGGIETVVEGGMVSRTFWLGTTS